jgi:hypothetical protein
MKNDIDEQTEKHYDNQQEKHLKSSKYDFYAVVVVLVIGLVWYLLHN